MSKSTEFILQLSFILFVALIPSLVIIRVFEPAKALAENFKENDPQVFLNPLVAFVNEGVIERKHVKESPVLLSIPAHDLQLPVAEGKISDKVWELYDDKVAWLSTSDEPGEGNVILYAHNQKHLFAPLHDVEVGEEIVVEHGGWEYLYEIVEKRKVEPSDVDSVLTDQEQLTLYTCDGTFDQRRLVVIARPKA